MPAKKKKVVRAKAKKELSTDDFPTARELREILMAHAKDFRVVHHEPKRYYLETKGAHYKGKPIMFAAVMMGKAYVSFHLFPLYVKPGAVKSVSPELKKRMQGKTCFNFKAPHAELFRELEQLTKNGWEIFREKSWGLERKIP